MSTIKSGPVDESEKAGGAMIAAPNRRAGDWAELGASGGEDARWPHGAQGERGMSADWRWGASG